MADTILAPDGCYWIGSDHPFDLTEAYVNLRADLELASVPQKAVLHLTADSRYRLWVNGVFTGRGPERSWPASMAIDSRDITHPLRAGRNRLAVQVYCPGYSHFAYVHRAAAGVLGWLELDGRVVLTTDGDWRVSRDASWSSLVRRVSIYGSGVEDRDMARVSDWQEADCSAWARARILQPARGPIWAELRPRVTALPSESVTPLTTPWQTRLGPAVPTSTDPHVDLRAALAASSPGPLPETLAAGQEAIWIFDLGHSQSCLGLADVSALGGETLSVSYAEKQHDGKLVLSDPASYCRMRPTDRFTLRPGRQRVEGFSFRGARYLVFRLQTRATLTPAPLFWLRTQAYPLAERSLPDLSAPFDAIARMCRRTLLSCLLDGIVDGVWREASQWLGDVVPAAFALRAISNDPRPLRLALQMAAEGAEPSGFLPSVLPGDVPAYAVTDYNFSWVELLVAYADHPGAVDAPEVLARHWPALCRMLDHMDRLRDDAGLIRSGAGRRLFLDWSPIDRGEPNLTLNLRLLHALHLATGLARRLHRPDPWSARAAALSQAIRATHATARGWQESPGGKPASQLALAFLLLTGLVQGAEAETLADRVAARSLDPEDGPGPDRLVLASPFMHHYVFQALDRLGRRDAIRQIIALRWGRWALSGQPTTWENWDIGFPDGSACHAFSAHPLGWLHR